MFMTVMLMSFAVSRSEDQEDEENVTFPTSVFTPISVFVLLLMAITTAFLAQVLLKAKEKSKLLKFKVLLDMEDNAEAQRITQGLRKKIRDEYSQLKDREVGFKKRFIARRENDPNLRSVIELREVRPTVISSGRITHPITVIGPSMRWTEALKQT